MNGLRAVPQEISTLFPPPPSSSTSSSPSSSSSSVLPPNVKPGANLPPMTLWPANQESWSQLLLGGVVEEEDASSFAPYASGRRSVENWEGHPPMVYHSTVDTQMEMNMRQHNSPNGRAYYYGSDQKAAQAAGRSSWSQLVLPTSSPRSCITTSYGNNMLDFSNSNGERKNQQSEHLSECNSGSGAPFKKAKLQASSAQSPLKVRKEKLGDRITALHQLVSPFGKTDTASVLLEAIGYIRFLQSQIEALSSPYLGNRSRNSKNNGKGERSSIFPEDPGQLLNDHCMKRVGPPDQDAVGDQQKDLRSRGLCLVPVSFTLHVGSENGSDFWAPAFGAGFR